MRSGGGPRHIRFEILWYTLRGEVHADTISAMKQPRNHARIQGKLYKTAAMLTEVLERRRLISATDIKTQ